MSRKQLLAAWILLALQVVLIVVAFSLLTGPALFIALAVCIPEIMLLVWYARRTHNPIDRLQPIPPREGVSRSGQRTAEAFFRVREAVRREYESADATGKS